MQMIIFLLEQHIRYCEQQEGTDQIHPVAEDIIRAHIDEAQRHHQLHCHVQQAHLHVTYLQFIRHQLIGMFAMRRAQILMKYDTVAKWSKHHPRHRPIEISEKTHLLFSLSVVLS